MHEEERRQYPAEEEEAVVQSPLFLHHRRSTKGMETSVYMCFPCYQEFNTLEEVLVHQLTCNPEAEKGESVTVAPGGQAEGASETFLSSCDPQAAVGLSEQVDQSNADPSPTSLIQYQCGDCGNLYGSLDLWQQHRKLGQCQAIGSESQADGAEQNGAEANEELKQGGKSDAGENGGAESGSGGTAAGGAEMVENAGPGFDAKAGVGDEAGAAMAENARPGSEAPAGGGEGATAGTEMAGQDAVGGGAAEEAGATVEGEAAAAAGDDAPKTDEGEMDHSYVVLSQGVMLSQDHAYLQISALDTGKEAAGGVAKGVSNLEGAAPQNAAAPPPAAEEPKGPPAADAEQPAPAPRRRGGRKPKPPAPPATPLGLLCVDCGAAFTLVPELVAHRKTQHSLEGALHRCNICGESFLNTTLFLYHRKQHRKKESEGSGLEGGKRVVVVVQNSSEKVLEAVSEEQVVEEGQILEEAAAIILQCAAEEEVAKLETPSVDTKEQDSDASVPEGKLADAPDSGPPNFLCVDCGTGYASEQELAEHRKSVHGLKEAVHHCPECGEGFMNTTQFLYHRRKHKGKGEGGQEGTVNRAGLLVSPVRAGCPSSTLASLSAAAKRKCSPGLSALCKKLKVENGEDEGVSLGEGAEGDDIPSKGQPLSQEMEPQAAQLSRDWSRMALPHTCPHCGLTFTRRCLLRAHVSTHTGEKLFSCEQCGKEFSRPCSLQRHSRAHAEGKTHTCQRCGKSFGRLETLRRHQTIHEKGDGAQLPFACPACPSSFQTRPELDDHRATHAAPVYSCSECGQTFKRRKHLDQHTLMHQEKEPKACPICSVQFLNQSVLDNHLLHCSGKEDRSQGRGRGQGRGRSMGQLECDMCGHCCVTQEGLELHRLSHTGQTPLRCPLGRCRRRFLSEAALEQHVITHHCQDSSKGAYGKEYRYRCEHCGKGFAYASTFNLHMRIHTGERPYECSQCGKRFRQLPHLQDHERIHTGSRPFCCWVCGKSFSVAARLTEHARTHSGEKPYACSQCPQTFRSRSNLDKHARAQGHEPAPSPEVTIPVSQAPAPEGEGAVQTILLVQTPDPTTGTATATTAVYHGDPSSLVVLHPSVTMITDQEYQQTIEVIID
ncbi:hypothetical protein GJAV_G00005980 [Gymnothorax javanicus]|nr:hypothetical protein GJAV_G00005980 [Gymnothorax javanicus]